MSEGLIGLGHTMNILTLLDGRTRVIGCVKQFSRKPILHTLSAARPGILRDPSQGQ
jgi:hypothetical protein